MEMSKDLLEEIQNEIRKAVYELRQGLDTENNIRIFMPYYIQRLFECYNSTKLPSVNNTYDFILYGIKVETGYEQNRIIVSNCMGGYFPERVKNYFLHIIDNKGVITV